MVEVGSIVKIKNICFKEGVVDHSYKQGRPCVYLGEVDEKMYFISLSSAKESKKYITFKPNDKNNLMKPSQANVSNVIVKDLYYPYVTGYLENEEIKSVFETIKKYYKEIRKDVDEKILLLADNYLNGSYEDSNKEDFKKENRHL